MQISAKPIWNNQVALDKLLKKERAGPTVGLGVGWAEEGKAGKTGTTVMEQTRI